MCKCPILTAMGHFASDVSMDDYCKPEKKLLGFSLRCVFVPCKNNKLERLQIALLVVFNSADWCLEGIGVDVRGNLGRISRLGGGDRICNHFHTRVSRHLERAVRIALLCGESLDQGSIGRIGSEVGRQCDQHAFGSRTGDRCDVLVADAFRAHEHGLDALLARLTHDQTHFRVIAAEVDEVHALRFQLGDDGGVVAVTGVHAFKHDDWNLCRFQTGLDRSRHALTIRLLVVQNGSLLWLQLSTTYLAAAGPCWSSRPMVRKIYLCGLA